MADVPEADLVAAAAARAADILALDALDDDQLDFLVRLHELPDPITDGVENDRCI